MLKKGIKLVAVNLLLLLLLLGLVELFLQVVPPFNRIPTYRDAGIHHSGRSNFTYKGTRVGSISDFKVKVQFNSLGFNDVEHSVVRPQGTRRILVLGDSQVESLQVALDKSFHRLLEARLRASGKAVEVIALGRSGNGAREALELYREHGRQYDPAWVVWSYTDANDILDASPLKIARQRREVARVRKIPDALRSSVLATLLYTRQWMSRTKPVEVPADLKPAPFFTGKFAAFAKLKDWNQGVYIVDWPPVWEEAWAACQKDFLELVQEVRRDGREFIVISTAATNPMWAVKSHRHLPLEWDLDKPERLMHEFAETNGVPYLPAKRRLLEHVATTKEPTIFEYDGHLNLKGHEIVADVLYEDFSRRLE